MEILQCKKHFSFSYIVNVEKLPISFATKNNNKKPVVLFLFFENCIYVLYSSTKSCRWTLASYLFSPTRHYRSWVSLQTHSKSQCFCFDLLARGQLTQDFSEKHGTTLVHRRFVQIGLMVQVLTLLLQWFNHSDRCLVLTKKSKRLAL